jgi:HK97 gp10 family phage protein
MARGFLHGLERALRRIRLLPREVNDARNEALREWAADLEKTAKDLAPKRTGRLERSIEADVSHNAGVAFVRVVGKATQYAYYVEKGTSKMKAQPFLGPAAQIHRRTGERALQRIVPRHVGRG